MQMGFVLSVARHLAPADLDKVGVALGHRVMERARLVMVMVFRVWAMARRGGLLVAGFEAFGFQGLEDVVELVGEIRPGNFISLDAFAECKSR